jgi:hypothetical protein
VYSGGINEFSGLKPHTINLPIGDGWCAYAFSTLKLTPFNLFLFIYFFSPLLFERQYYKKMNRRGGGKKNFNPLNKF